MKTILSKSSILKLIILDTLLIFSTTVLYAQEIKVRNIVQLTTDITARSTARMDANNKECAIVRVNIPTIKTMSFGNAVVGDVEYKAGEYIIYVPEGTSQIPLSVEGYKNNPIDFSQYGLSVMSKNVYRVTLYIDNNDSLAQGKYGSMNITTKPESSYVLLDGMPIGQSPLTLHNILAGQHVLSFPNVNGYTLPDQTITIKENETFEKQYALIENTDVFDWQDNIPLCGSTNDGGMLYPVKYKKKTEGGKRGILDYWGHWVVPLGEFQYVDNDSYKIGNDDVFMVGNYVNENLKVGLYQPNNGLIVPCNYSNIKFVSTNLVSKVLIAVCENDKWGFFNVKGEEITPCIYDYFDCYPEDNVIVVRYLVNDVSKGKKIEKYGLLDLDGNIISPPYYDAISFFQGGLAGVKKGNDVYIINNKGNEVKDLTGSLYRPSLTNFRYSTGLYTENLWCLQKGYQKLGVLNSNFKELTPFTYSDCNYIGNGWIKLTEYDSWVVVNKNEHIYQGNEKNGERAEIVGKYLMLTKEGRCGMLDIDGNVVLPFEYNGVHKEDNYIIAYKEDDIFIYDMSLKELLKIEGSENLSICNIKKGLILVSDSETNKYGIMNIKGEILSGCLFDSSRVFEFYLNSGEPWDNFICHGLGLICLGDRCGFINKYGKIVVPQIYSFIVPFWDGTVYGLKPDGTWVDLKLEQYDE